MRVRMELAVDHGADLPDAEGGPRKSGHSVHGPERRQVIDEVDLPGDISALEPTGVRGAAGRQPTMSLPVQAPVDHSLLSARRVRLPREPPPPDVRRVDAHREYQLASAVDGYGELLERQHGHRPAAKRNDLDASDGALRRAELKPGDQLAMLEIVPAAEDTDQARRRGEPVPIDLQIAGQRIRRPRESFHAVTRDDPRESAGDAYARAERRRTYSETDDAVGEIGRDFFHIPIRFRRTQRRHRLQPDIREGAPVKVERDFPEVPAAVINSQGCCCQSAE